MSDTVRYGIRDDLTGEVTGGFKTEIEAWAYLQDAPLNWRDATLMRSDLEWTEWVEAFA